jgi:hypothetical protein
MNVTEHDPSRERNEQDVRILQLEQAYETAKSVYTSSLQFITVAAVAEAALLTVGIEAKSAIMILVGGCLMVLLVFQLRQADRVLLAAMVTALSLEQELGLVGKRSLVRVFVLGTQRRARLMNLLQEVAQDDDSLQLQRRELGSGHGLVYRGIGTLLVLLFGIAQIVAGAMLLITGW